MFFFFILYGLPFVTVDIRFQTTALNTKQQSNNPKTTHEKYNQINKKKE